MITPRTDTLWKRVILDGWHYDAAPIDYIMASHEELEKELASERLLADMLVKSAKALVDRWEAPFWKDAPHTGKFIRSLDDAISTLETDRAK